MSAITPIEFHIRIYIPKKMSLNFYRTARHADHNILVKFIKIYLFFIRLMEIKTGDSTINYRKDLHVSKIVHALQDYYYFPQVSIPFARTLPPVCSKLHSNIQIACYNWTNPPVMNDNPEVFLTHVIPEINSWDELDHLMVWASKKSLTAMQYNWIAIKDTENYSEAVSTKNLANMKELILNTSFGMSNPLNIHILDDELNSHKFKALETFNIDYAGGSQASVSLNDDFSDAYYTITKFSKITLSGSTLIVAGVADATYDYDTKMEIDVFNRSVFASGYAVELLHGLQDLLNFSVVPFITTDWGSINAKTGEWEGMVGAAIRGDIDLAISSSSIDWRRTEVVDYNIHTHVNVLTAFFKRYSGYPLNSLFLPFTTSLWISVWIWMCVNKLVFILIHLTIYWNDFYGDDGRDSENPITAQELVPWLFAPITNRGVPKPSSLLPLRALYFSELVVAVVLYAAFSGTLISYLSIDYNPIQTIGDIVNSDYNVEVLNYKGTHENLMESHEASTKLIYWKSQTYKRVTESPVKEIGKGKFVYLIHHMAGFGEINKCYNPVDACNIQSIPIKDQFRKQGAFVRKGSQLRKIIDFGLLKLMEQGIIEVLKRRHLFHAPVCYKPMEFSGADIFDLQTAFVLMLCGYMLSFFILLIEKFCNVNKYKI